jgi:hypothetical protein
MDRFREMLTLIDSGTSSFKSEGQTEGDMVAFQSIAQALIDAENKGLIEKCLLHQESRTGNRWYDLVVVLGGLTEKGKQLLTPNKTET